MFELYSDGFPAVFFEVLYLVLFVGCLPMMLVVGIVALVRLIVKDVRAERAYARELAERRARASREGGSRHV